MISWTNIPKLKIQSLNKNEANKRIIEEFGKFLEIKKNNLFHAFILRRSKNREITTENHQNTGNDFKVDHTK